MAGVQTISEYFLVYYFLMYLIRNRHTCARLMRWTHEACLRERLLSFAVIGMVVEDGDGAVELFGQKDAHHAVRGGG